MNCYNGERYLREAIDSVLKQTYAHWELIFWDNASEDATATITQSYADPRIRYFRGERNVTLGAARNLALAEAGGEFIAFLDSDDRWLPDKLERQIRWFLDNPSAGFCYSNYFALTHEGRVRSVALRDDQPQGEVFSRFLRQYPVNLQTVMLRAAEFDLWFDPALEVSEEYDVFMQLLMRMRVGYIAQPLVEYRIHPAMASIRKIERYAVENAMVLEKLLAIAPDLEIRYPAELRHYRAKLGYYSARAAMANGRPDLARAALLPHVKTGPGFMALYLLAWLGQVAWNLVHRAVGRFAK